MSRMPPVEPGQPGRRPAVSVVLPTRDRAGLILRSVRSVLGQQGVDLELLVVDDGSTDGTPQLLAQVDDPRLRILRQPASTGAGAARNRGIQAARAAWVAFQDDDDEWLPGKLAAQMDAAARSPDAVVVYADMELHAANGGIRPYPAPPPPSDLVDGRGDWSPLGIGLATCVIRRDALERVGGFDESLPRFIDLDLLVRLIPEGPFVHVSQPFLRYHETPGISSNKRNAAIARLAILAKHARSLSRKEWALQEHFIGVAFCSSGDLPAGRPHLWRAWRSRPWNAAFLSVALVASHRRLYRLAQRAHGGAA